ncbi:MAG: hypothetical protein ACI85E_001184, partial [Marinomonas primoryensis]
MIRLFYTFCTAPKYADDQDKTITANNMPMSLHV